MRVAITGGAGMLAHAVAAVGTAAGHDVLAFDRRGLDVTQPDRVHAVIEAARPDAVIHCAAYTRVDDAEEDSAAAELLNATATGFVAAAAAACDAVFVFPSTDYVFDGRADVPYNTDAATNPLNAYGASKLRGEHAASAAPRHYVVRTSWLYGANGRNFVTTMLAHGRAGKSLRVVNDQRGTPTWTDDLARMMFALLDAHAPAGVYHATDSGDTTWYEFARCIFNAARVDADVAPASSDQYPQKAERPRYSVLDCSRTYAITGPMPHWRDSLVAALQDMR